MVVKQVDETIVSSTTLQDDNELFVPVRVNQAYGYQLHILLNSHANADFKYRWTIPSGASGTKKNQAWTTTPNTTDLITATRAKNTSGSDQSFDDIGSFKIASSDGFAQLQWSPNIDVVDSCTVKAGSWLMVSES